MLLKWITSLGLQLRGTYQCYKYIRLMISLKNVFEFNYNLSAETN